MFDNGFMAGTLLKPSANVLIRGSGGNAMRVAFFQRIFAHYQSGLVRELATHSTHDYRFYSDIRDPMSSGIDPLSEDLRSRVAFTPCRTVQWTPRLVFQGALVREAWVSRSDVIIIEGAVTYPTNWLALRMARWRRKRVLVYTHGWLKSESPLRQRVRAHFYRMADGVLLYNERAKRIGIAQGLPASRLYVVFNGLDEEAMRPWRERLTDNMCRTFRSEHFGSRSHYPLLTSVGRLTAAKQYGLLVDAAVRLRSAGRDVNLLLVGDGPERARIEAAARESGVHLIFAGARRDEEFLSLCFASADATVIPGAAGLTVVHSLSYGTPVIVHDDDEQQMPESEAVQSGFNGARFRYGRADDLAEAVERVLTCLPRGPRTGAQCRAVVSEKYNPVRMREVFDHAVAGLPASDSAHEESEVERRMDRRAMEST